MDLVRAAFDSGAMERPERFDPRRRPPCELLEIDATVDERTGGSTALRYGLSQRRQGVLDVLVLLIGRELLEFGSRQRFHGRRHEISLRSVPRRTRWGEC